MKKNIIRVGDTVKVIIPELFLRCGYPMTIMDVLEKMWDKYDKDVDEFIAKVLGKTSAEKSLFETHSTDYYICMNKFQYAIAYTLLSQFYHFGGTERKVYTANNSYYQDNVGEVISIRYVKTGTRVASSRSYSYDGEVDYAPAYLDKVKTHKILGVKLDRQVIIIIEATNVEKVEKQ